MNLNFLKTDKAPGAVGPYSQGVKAGNMVFTSGQLPIDPATGEMVSNNIKEATRVSLNNVLGVVEAAGGKKENIAKVNVYVIDIEKFGEINEVYTEFFGEHKPARALVEVSKLPKGGDIEIEAIAVI